MVLLCYITFRIDALCSLFDIKITQNYSFQMQKQDLFITSGAAKVISDSTFQVV